MPCVQVCEKLKDPNIRLADAQIELFQPFKPMLAQNIKLEEVKIVCGCGGNIRAPYSHDPAALVAGSTVACNFKRLIFYLLFLAKYLSRTLTNVMLRLLYQL